MREELDILKIVAENPSISQRKISEQTGISLGQVNFLIKKCVKKGLIKIEGQTSKSIKYNLTPKGLSEKATLTMQYIKVSYAAVIALTDKIRAVVDQAIKMEDLRRQEHVENLISMSDNNVSLEEKEFSTNVGDRSSVVEDCNKDYKIYVCGDHDEIMEIVKLALNDKRISLEIFNYESLKGNTALLNDNINIDNIDLGTAEPLDSIYGNISLVQNKGKKSPNDCDFNDKNDYIIVLYWDEAYRELCEKIHCVKAINVLH